jgi:hypothetical protein
VEPAVRYHSEPAKSPHFWWAKGEVILQIPHSEDIIHPTCAKCGAPMWMTRIEPDGPGLEKRTFECQACQNEAIEIVKYP